MTRSLALVAVLTGMVAAALSPGFAHAQTGPAATAPPPDAASPQVAPTLPPGTPPLQAQSGPEKGTLNISASLAGDTKPIRSGLVWRVFEDRGSAAPQLVQRSTAALPSLQLDPGNYIVHVAYGFASATMRVAMNSTARTERLSVAAGALKLSGVIGDVPIPPNRLSFSIFIPVGNDTEGRLVISNVRPGQIVRLPEGTYHIVSTYGDSNAIMGTDLKVETGRLTEATLNHHAATVTLKLVASNGGEAFAGTAFSVLTPGGDVIREAIGAFPTVTLAEGEYVLIARHDGHVYTRDFKVESGLDRDIEVLVTPS